MTPRMPEPFSHEDFMQAGQRAAAILEALEDKDLQRHYLDAREAVQHVYEHLKDKGFDNRTIAQSLLGVVLSPILPDD